MKLSPPSDIPIFTVCPKENTVRENEGNILSLTLYACMEAEERKEKNIGKSILHFHNESAEKMFNWTW